MKIWKEKVEGTNRYAWSGDGTVNGRRLRPRNMATKAEVEAVFDVAKAQKHQRKYDLPVERPDVYLSDLVAERVRDLSPARRDHRKVRAILERFRDHFAGDPLVTSLTAKDLLDYKRARVTRSKLKPRSINTELMKVGAMLRRAGDYFPSLASWKPPAVPYEAVPETGRERVITRDETARLLEALRAPLLSPGDEPGRLRREAEAGRLTRLVVADLWELAPLVGMRTSELRLMEWAWVDFSEGVVRLPAHVTKGNRAREVPLNGEALALLRRRRAEGIHRRHVFPNPAGTGPLRERRLYDALKAAALRAGLPYGQNVEGGFRLHDNRHTAVTRMLQSGADTATVGAVVGHSRQYMTLVYSHPSAESKRRAVEKLSPPEGALDKNSTRGSKQGGD